MNPFPDDPIRVPCPGCGAPVLFPRLADLAPGTVMSCNCPRCGQRVSSLTPLGSPPSRGRRIGVLVVAVVVAVVVVLLLVK